MHCAPELRRLVGQVGWHHASRVRWHVQDVGITAADRHKVCLEELGGTEPHVAFDPPPHVAWVEDGMVLLVRRKDRRRRGQRWRVHPLARVSGWALVEIEDRVRATSTLSALQRTSAAMESGRLGCTARGRERERGRALCAFGTQLTTRQPSVPGSSKVSGASDFAWVERFLNSAGKPPGLYTGARLLETMSHLGMAILLVLQRSLL